jgi:ribosome-binding protein aMBF1 (putative translation factor)
MAPSHLRKAEKVDFQAEIGGCLERARCWLGWSLKECAAKLGRDERQVSRWESGTERTQVDVVMAVEELQQPFAAQLAKLSGADIHVHVSFRRIA